MHLKMLSGKWRPSCFSLNVLRMWCWRRGIDKGGYHLQQQTWSTSRLSWYWFCKRLNTLKLRQDGHHFADDTSKCIFLNENVWIPITIRMEFVPKGPINNIPALVQIMAWRRLGDKPLSESMMVNLPTHICITRPQWVKVKQSASDRLTLFYTE